MYSDASSNSYIGPFYPNSYKENNEDWFTQCPSLADPVFGSDLRKAGPGWRGEKCRGHSQPHPWNRVSGGGSRTAEIFSRDAFENDSIWLNIWPSSLEDY